MNTKVLPACLLIGFVVGCGFVDVDSPDSEVTEGVDFTKNPLKALGALQDMASEAEKLQQELENMTAVETLHFSQLIKVLPNVPPGWTATEPKGSTTQMGEAKVSNAKREYREEGTNRQVTVSIDDWAFHKLLYMPFFIGSKFSQESTDGYNKGITVGDSPGMENYTFKSKSGKRSLLIHKRYHVQISLRNAEPEGFNTWANRVKTNELPAQ